MRIVQGVGIAVLASALLAGCGSTPLAPDSPTRELLAPDGKLRVGLYLGSPTSILRDSGSSEARGVGHDLGMALARRLGVAFEPVVFPANAQLLEAVRAGRVDVVFTNATPERAGYLDFTPTVLEVEQGYLVPSGSRIANAADVDRPGVRVGVSQGSTSQKVLGSDLKHAAVVPAPTLQAAREWLSAGKLDAYATNKAILFEMGERLPGSKVLDGRWGVEHFALGIPKGRERAMPYLGRVVGAMASDGEVDRAVERAGLRGTRKPD
jgi:polar amino acid transport system substrate-binding protein